MWNTVWNCQYQSIGKKWLTAYLPQSFFLSWLAFIPDSSVVLPTSFFSWSAVPGMTREPLLKEPPWRQGRTSVCFVFSCLSRRAMPAARRWRSPWRTRPSWTTSSPRYDPVIQPGCLEVYQCDPSCCVCGCVCAAPDRRHSHQHRQDRRECHWNQEALLHHPVGSHFWSKWVCLQRVCEPLCLWFNNPGLHCTIIPKNKPCVYSLLDFPYVDQNNRAVLEGADPMRG